MMKKILFPVIVLFLSLTSFAGKWHPFSFTTARGGVYCASSELNKPAGFSFGKYGPHNLFDRDPATAWVEGDKGSGTGSYVCVGLGSNLKPYVVIANGYQKTHDLFLANNRVRTLKVTLYLGITDPRKETQVGFLSASAALPETREIELKDEEGYQVIRLPFRDEEIEQFSKKLFRDYVLSHKEELYKDKSYSWLKMFYFVKFEIAGVYKGSKWDDTCLSDLLFSDQNKVPFIPRNEKILTVLESDNEGEILVRTVSGKVFVLDSVSREDLLNGTVLSVIEVSPDKQWAVIDKMTGGAGRGTEESYKLFYLPLLMEVKTAFLYDMGEALGFGEKNGKLHIRLFDGEMPAEDVKEDVTMMDNFSFFVDAGIEALPVLFSEAVKNHNTGAILSCMDNNYLHEQLVSLHKNDTTVFLNEQFCGNTPSGGPFACLDMKKVAVVGGPRLEQVDDSTWQLTMTVTDGEKTVNAVWTIIENEGEGPEPVFGLSGAVG